MKAQITPWHFSSTHSGQAYDIGAADGANIALVYGPKDGGPEDFKDNARVMTVAWDMLGLLQELIDIEGPQPGTAHWATKVRAIIVKATGAA
jgi:hypothetical protein